MNTLDLFAGAGGLSFGLEKAGFDPYLGIEFDESACQTYRKNITAPCIKADLTELTPQNAPVSKDQVELIAGGPPCQDFSVANYYSRGGQKTNLVFVFSKWVNELEPEYFIMENVPGITSVGNVFHDLLEIFHNSGYKTTSKILNSEYFSVPQKRKRMFIIGSKEDTLEIDQPNLKQKNVGEAFRGLPSINSGEEDKTINNHKAPNHQQKTIKRIKQTKQGESLYDSWSEKIKLDPDKPAPTLKAGKRANFHFAHPSDNRGLTIRERARLQSFPDSFIFKGTITDQRTQTGNAVPPNMSKYIGECLLGSEKSKGVFDY